MVNPDRLATEKALFLVHRHHSRHIQHSFAIRGIVVPVISESTRSRLEPASAASALLALAPSTILQLPGAGRSALTTMSRLVQRVPSYVLRLGRDLDTLPTLLERVLPGKETT
jgi:hypothetical protein